MFTEIGKFCSNCELCDHMYNGLFCGLSGKRVEEFDEACGEYSEDNDIEYV